MPLLHIPAEHTDADLALAGELADALGSSELYVAWTHEAGSARPEVMATLREPEPKPTTPFTPLFTAIFHAVRNAWRALIGPKLPPASAASPDRTPA
jgi:hypothetical protein